jgi:cytochrome P450
MDLNLPGDPTGTKVIFLTIPPPSTSVRRLFVAAGGHETTLSLILGDVEIGRVTIPGRDAILACYRAAGRDADQHGEGADRSDINHASGRHLAFGAAPLPPRRVLARLEGILALKGLFTQYPEMTLAADLASLPPVPSLLSNSARIRPVRLGPE